MDEETMLTRIVKLEEQIKNVELHLTSLDNMSLEMKNLTCSIIQLTEQSKNTNEEVKETRADINKLKENPGQIYMTIRNAVIVAFCSGIVAYVVSQTFK